MTNLTNIRFKDGDGEDDRIPEGNDINIRTVHNGWILTSTNPEGAEYVGVFSFNNPTDLLKKLEIELDLADEEE